MIKKITFVGLIVVIVFFLLLGVSSYIKEVPKDVMSINYTFMVKDGVGFNLDTDKLNFGGGPSGSSLQRKLNISSTYDAMVHIESEGPGSIILSQNDFEIAKDEPLELVFVLVVPDLPLELYEGTIYVQFYERS